MNLLVLSQFLIENAVDFSLAKVFHAGECDSILLLGPVDCDALGPLPQAEIHRQEIEAGRGVVGRARAMRRAMLQFFKRMGVKVGCQFTIPSDDEAFLEQICHKLPAAISVCAVSNDEADKPGLFTKIPLEDLDAPVDNFFLSSATRYEAPRPARRARRIGAKSRKKA
jgi:hypothetical protein